MTLGLDSFVSVVSSFYFLLPIILFPFEGASSLFTSVLTYAFSEPSSLPSLALAFSFSSLFFSLFSFAAFTFSGSTGFLGGLGASSLTIPLAMSSNYLARRSARSSVTVLGFGFSSYYFIRADNNSSVDILVIILTISGTSSSDSSALLYPGLLGL